MSSVQLIFNALTDAQLRAVVLDLQSQDESGVLPQGPARELVRRIVAETQVSFNDAFQLVQHEPLRRAAFKWAASGQCEKVDSVAPEGAVRPITEAMVLALHDATDRPKMECLKALRNAGGSHDKAFDALRVGNLVTARPSMKTSG